MDAARSSLLYKAALLGNWDTAKIFFDIDPNAMVAKISARKETALHVAVAAGHSKAFVGNLADLMSEKGIRFDSITKEGFTVLHFAAIVGNTEAAKIIASKAPLLHMQKWGYLTPLHLAADRGHKDTTLFLLSLIQNESPIDSVDIWLLYIFLITNDFYDIAIVLLKRYLHSAFDKDACGMALLELARKPQAFPSGIRLSHWQRVLYHFFSGSSTNEYKSPEKGDIENPTEPQLRESKSVYGFLMKDVINTKLMHKQAIEMLKLLIAEILKSSAPEADERLVPSLMLAARNGIHEFVTEVIKAYPSSVRITDKDNHTIFDVAVIFRQEKVYNLLYQFDSKEHFVTGFDGNYNNMLHLAAKYESCSQINSISNAALQMQRELQWYKEVEQLVQPSYRTIKNYDTKLPETLFTESHQKLVENGEKWMKEIAQSGTTVATLVVTVVLAAAFTIPGSSNGDDDNNYTLKVAHVIFVISNALALFSSAISVIMFLGIFTSRYLEEDFLKALPRKLAIGLIFLFFSVISMLVASGTALGIVSVNQWHWVAVPIFFLASMSVASLAFVQFPVLVQIVASTFGPSIFGKQSDELLWKLQEVPPFPSSDVNVEVHHI